MHACAHPHAEALAFLQAELEYPDTTYTKIAIFCSQLPPMTGDISSCCQNIINKTLGTECGTISPFNHSQHLP